VRPPRGGSEAEGSGSQPAQAETDAGADGNAETTQAGAPAEITTEERTVIRETIIERDVERVDLDIDISIGISVPQTVTFYDLPPRIIEIVPAYRTYKYFVLVDGTICIVDPDTYVIVYIIEA
jgi:hypothetical protein